MVLATLGRAERAVSLSNSSRPSGQFAVASVSATGARRQPTRYDVIDSEPSR
jgi:hypothetical protein